MQKKLLIVLLVVALLICSVGLLPVHGEEEIYDTVVRLHVLANSDSEEDQALKLKVRDVVLEVTAPLLRDCRTRDEAVAILEQHEAEIKRTAEEVVRQQGYDNSITVTLDEEYYPERSYDSFCFPSGTYLSMRVCIGEANGHNWWCCLFPSLCLGAATVSTKDAEDSFIAVGLTPSQYKIITETDNTVYKVRFKILELFH